MVTPTPWIRFTSTEFNGKRANGGTESDAECETARIMGTSRAPKGFLRVGIVEAAL